MIGQLYTEVSVVFKNVQFHRATNIPKEGIYISTVLTVVCFGSSSTFPVTRRHCLCNPFSYKDCFLVIWVYNFQYVYSDNTVTGM